MSEHSVGSRGSQASRAEAAANVAGLKIRLKYHDLEAQKRREFEKLELQKELDVAEARFTVFASEAEQTLLYGKDIQVEEPHSAEKYVQDYINNNPLLPNPTETPILPHKSGVPDTGPKTTPLPRASTRLGVGLDASTPPFVPQVNLSDITRTFAEHINLGRLPTPEPGVFTGDPIAYVSWKAAFEILIESRGIPPAERIYYLKKYLGGSARESVEGFLLLNSDQAYDEAKALLDRRFGNQFVVANAWPKVDGRDGPALRRLSDYLGQCLVAMRTINSLSVWNDE